MKPLVDRFWAKVDRRGVDECWLWKASTNGPGYGQISKGRLSEGLLLAHRLSYELAHGAIPPKAMVLHSCDVKQCVNPRHLRLGTARENAYDAVQRGQWNPGRVYGDRNGARTHPESRLRGEANTNAKLTEAQVTEIRRLYATGNYYQRELGAAYGIGQVTVSAIVRGRTWTEHGEPVSGPRKPRQRQDPKPCAACGRLYKPLRRGLCGACYVHGRRHG